MPIQRQKSNRLYFKKWAYRIECSIYGGWNIRPFIKKNVPFQRSTTEVFYYGWGAVSDREEAILKKFFNIVSPKLQDKSATQYRIEGNTFNIFCNDPKLAEFFEKELKKWIVSIHEPADQYEKDFLINNGHTKILCNHLPKFKYAYKVVLKGNMKIEQRVQFFEWLEKYDNNQVLIGNSSKNWLSGQSYWKQDPFFYVKDSSMLTMLTLFLGANIRNIYEYIPRHTLVKE